MSQSSSRAQSFPDRQDVCFVLEGKSASAAQTSLALAIGGGEALTPEGVGIPVAVPMYLNAVASSWLSGSTPSGDWTLTIYRRKSAASTFNPVATFTVGTS